VAVDPTLIPQDEDKRPAAVRGCDVLDTPPDGAFERITALAAGGACVQVIGDVIRPGVEVRDDAVAVVLKAV
jgi:hypothetical protein